MKDNFHKIINSEVPTLIDFSAEWCGPCKMMAPVLEQLKNLMGESVRIIKIDVDLNPAISSAMQIQGVPTLTLFQNGKLLWRQSGVIQAQQLAGIIKQNAKLD